MMQKGLLAVLAACAGVAFTGLPLPGTGELGSSKAYADGRRAKAVSKSERAVSARGFYRVGGYYSYTDREVINSWAWARTFFISRSPFRTPLTGLQSPAGPFDSGFFFDSGLRPHWWNNAPYPN